MLDAPTLDTKTVTFIQRLKSSETECSVLLVSIVQQL